MLDRDQDGGEIYRRVCGQKAVRARPGLLVTGHRWPRSGADFDIVARDMPRLRSKRARAMNIARRFGDDYMRGLVERDFPGLPGEGEIG